MQCIIPFSRNLYDTITYTCTGRTHDRDKRVGIRRMDRIPDPITGKFQVSTVQVKNHCQPSSEKIMRSIRVHYRRDSYLQSKEP